MIEDVSGIHADGAFETFANFESLAHSHIRIPNSRRFDGVQADIAAPTGLCVLQDDVSRRLQGYGLQSTEPLQAWINRRALRIRFFDKEVAKVVSGIRASGPGYAPGSLEVERPYLVRSPVAIEHGLATDRYG